MVSLLEIHHEALEPELREKVVGSLVLLRNKDVIDSPTYVHGQNLTGGIQVLIP